MDYLDDDKPATEGTESPPMRADSELERIRRTASIQLSPEQFERLYLQPFGRVKGDLRKTFGNPTPVALGGFVMTVFPLACELMGWRNAGQLGGAIIGSFFFVGGPCLWVGGLLEFFLGNTFSFVVFFVYGGIVFGWGATMQPFYNAAGSFAPPSADTGSQYAAQVAGQANPSFWSSVAFFPMAAGMLSLVFMIGALRINAVFLVLFFSAAVGFLILAGALWEEGVADHVLFVRLCKGAGGCFFVASLLGWYLFFIQIIDAVGFKWTLPVGDFSVIWARREGTHYPGGEV